MRDLYYLARDSEFQKIYSKIASDTKFSSIDLIFVSGGFVRCISGYRSPVLFESHVCSKANYPTDENESITVQNFSRNPSRQLMLLALRGEQVMHHAKIPFLMDNDGYFALRLYSGSAAMNLSRAAMVELKECVNKLAILCGRFKSDLVAAGEKPALPISMADLLACLNSDRRPAMLLDKGLHYLSVNAAFEELRGEPIGALADSCRSRPS